jgi:uncharacterized protein (DUF1800 family)
MTRRWVHCFAVSAFGLLAIAPIASQTPVAPTAVDETRALALHVLNRLAFGPRPGDVDRVVQMGVDRWIEEQLRGEHINDASAAKALVGCAFWTDPVANVVQQLAGPVISRSERPSPNGSGVMVMTVAISNGVQVVKRDSARRNERFSSALLETGQLLAGRLTRAESSDQQLIEVMTDFWENHFSIASSKTLSRGLIVEWDRAVIRPRALGKFRDLLGAVAHSPAMLHYLDNDVSFAGELNENYGRELLELHTLGVDGGYTQADVNNVARAFTGWTHSLVSNGRISIANMGGARGAVFSFNAARHDTAAKVVLGRTLPAGRGAEDGEDVLDILARHPSTAKFIAKKLVVRFVSDVPPSSLVDRAAATYLQTNGDIREVMRTIVTSPEFRSPTVFGAKVKTPVELVLSTRRALGAPVDTAAEMIDLLIDLEQPPFGHLTPEGWPETGERWMNAGAMRTRLSIATRIANSEMPSIPVEQWPLWASLSRETFDRQVDGVVRTLLDGRISDGTRAVLIAARPTNDEAAARASAMRELVAIALSSPEFQRR